MNYYKVLFHERTIFKVMRISYYFLVLIALFPLKGQAKCDSLALAIETATDTDQIDAYNEYARCFFGEDYSKTDSLTRIAINKAKAIDYKSGMARANQNFGLILLYRDQNEEEAFKFFTKALHLYEAAGDSLGTGIALGDIAGTYRRRGELGDALENSIRGLAIFEAEGYDRGISVFTNNIGAIFMTTGEAEEAIPYFRRALTLVDTLRDRKNYATQLGNLLSVFIILEVEDSVNNYFNRVIRIQKEGADYEDVAITYSNMQSFYEGIKDEQNPIFKIRKDYADSAYYYANLGEDKIELAVANYYKGLLIKLEGNDQFAYSYFEKALEIGRDLPFIDDEISQSYFLMSEISYEKEEYKRGYDELLSAYHMMETINESKIEKTVLETKARFKLNQSKKELELIKKEKALSDLELQRTLAENARKDAEAKQDAILLYAVGAMLALAIVFGFVVFRAYRNKKATNALILEQKGAVELQKAELNLQNKVVAERNREITDSINYARRIQKAILPSEKIVDAHLPNSFVLYKPKDIVSGDFYWVEKQNDAVLFGVADCTGHGVPGAMVSVVCSNGLSRAVNEFGKTSPAEILNQTNLIIQNEFANNRDRVADGMDIAICKLQGRTLTFAGANRPLWICRDGEIIEVDGDRKSIKSGDENNVFKEHKLELEPNDVVYLFSKGFVDQFGGEEGKKLKLSNLRRFVIAIHSFESFKQKVMINKAFEDWKGGIEQMDDVCMMGVKIGE